MAGAPLDEDFDAAAELLATQVDAEGGGLDDFNLAAALIEAPQAPEAPRRLGFERRGPAHMAYMRTCLALQRSQQQREAVEAKLDALKQRLRRGPHIAALRGVALKGVALAYVAPHMWHRTSIGAVAPALAQSAAKRKLGT